MRKIISFTLCAALALPLAAQSWDQALMFGENVYGGTARSIGMGNALTAVGGDLGSIGINPAGGAVAGYSQFVVTPGLSISATVAQGSSADGRDPVGLADRVSTGYTRLKLPNIGFSMNMDTGRRHGLKRLSFGFVSNSTNDFTYRMNASGSYYGDYTYTGSLASLAQGFDPKVLWGDWFAEGGKAYEPAWSAMAATQSHIIDHIGDSQYLGVTEALVGKSAGDLWQKYGYQTRGYKQDILLNMSANFDDKFYIGANLGITTLAYTRSEYWEEGPEDKAKFPQLEYDEGAKKATLNSVFTKSMYTVSGTGIYFKAGLLWRPVAGLRLGAAIQTPTLMNMTGRYAFYGETSMTGAYFSPSQSPEDEWVYSFTMPFRWNAGVAYSFGSFAVLSVDYEMADYSLARYGGRSEFGYSTGGWTAENNGIRGALGIGHYVRAGLEFKPTANLSARVGYNLISGAQRNWLYWEDTNPNQPILEPLTARERASQVSHLVSFGAGYSVGHFFADLAVRLSFVPQSLFTPYHHYESGANFYDKYVNDYDDKGNFIVPEVLVSATGIDTVLSIGWRF